MDDQSPARADPASAAGPQHPEPPDLVPLRLCLQPGGAVLEVTRAEAIVGRHTEAEVRLPLPDVSRRHCRLVWQHGRWQVHDLNSLNGVFVNDRQVQQATLRAGDLLRIGGFIFRIELGAAGGAGDVLHDLLKARRGPGPATPRRRRAS
jgi:pSer/pThr/pTyr-binding forkhead associated (FHA) protein